LLSRFLEVSPLFAELSRDFGKDER
jgi:hypothetical protein